MPSLVLDAIIVMMNQSSVPHNITKAISAENAERTVLGKQHDNRGDRRASPSLIGSQILEDGSCGLPVVLIHCCDDSAYTVLGWLAFEDVVVTISL
jgi:hypothetical protein